MVERGPRPCAVVAVVLAAAAQGLAGALAVEAAGVVGVMVGSNYVRVMSVGDEVN